MKKAVFQTQEKEVVCCKDIIKYSIIGLLSTLYRTAERGVCNMSNVLNFLVSVMASVAGYYICKWLDRNRKDS